MPARTGKAVPTVREVAKEAGVALGSVSRVLNGHPDVNPDVRHRVLEAARRLNYARLRRRSEAPRAPHPRARSAIRVGLICFGMEDTLVQLPVVSTALHGIEDEVSAEGGSLLFASIPRGDRVPAFLRDGQVDGVIVKGPNMGLLPPPEENELVRSLYRLPHVWLLGRLPNARGDHCNFDQEIAGRLAAEHLRDQGHRHVAFLNPKPGHAQFEAVKRAFCAATESWGNRADVLEPPSPANLDWPLPAVSAEEKVEALARKWAAARPSARATALAVGADTTAVQLYSVLARMGLRAGVDVGIISCNDERSLISGLTPALTTVDVRADAVGRNAVARLLWRIRHEPDAPAARLLIEPSLSARASVPRRSNT